MDLDLAREFLHAHHRGVLATSRSDGRPQLSPVLCAVDDQPRALREIRRVLRPGGKFLFLEHVRSSEPKVARKQDRLNGIQLRVGRCNCNRPTVDSIRAAGFQITELTHGALPTAPAPSTSPCA